MIHFLQCLWWEWRWRRLRNARWRVVATMTIACSGADRRALKAKVAEVDREMTRLEALMSGGGR